MLPINREARNDLDNMTLSTINRHAYNNLYCRTICTST